MTLCRPLRRSVIIPSSTALRRSSSPDAPTRISSRNSSRDLHHFIEADAALVAGVVALLAAAALLRDHLLRFVRREAGLDERLGGACGSSILQLVQIRRTRRCAQMRLTELATRNGSMPMFINRLIVLGASLVWSVESTR